MKEVKTNEEDNRKVLKIIDNEFASNEFNDNTYKRELVSMMISQASLIEKIIHPEEI